MTRSKIWTMLGGLFLLAGCCTAQYRACDYGVPPEGLSEVPATEKSFVDRHPMLSAPRNYYRDSSNNVVVKAFYGTFVGVPVGIYREGAQIVYGQ